MFNIDEKLMKRFWDKVDIRSQSDCWNWNASSDKQGYGQFATYSNGRMKNNKAHRVSALLANMNIEGLCVCHTCDNPKCVNPNHLFVGTQLDNMRDKVFKGKSKNTGGKKNLTKLDVLEIRLLANSMPKQEIAERYNVTLDRIYKIVSHHHGKL